jgi:hypothetical protein
MGKTVSEVVARPIRTAAQATPSWILTEFVDAWLFDMSERQFAATVLLLTMLFAYGQAAVENAAGRGFLRKVPPKDVPVVEPEVPVEPEGEEFEFEEPDPAMNDGLPVEDPADITDVYGQDARDH